MDPFSDTPANISGARASSEVSAHASGERRSTGTFANGPRHFWGKRKGTTPEMDNSPITLHRRPSIQSLQEFLNRCRVDGKIRPGQKLQSLLLKYHGIVLSTFLLWMRDKTDADMALGSRGKSESCGTEVDLVIWTGSSTTVALLNPAVTAVAGSGIAVPVPDGAVSTETITEQAQWDDSRSIPSG